MRISTKKLGIAAAAVTLTVWIICSLAVALFPQGTMEIAGHLLHLQPEAHDWALTWGSFAMGAICWTGFAFLAGWGIAFVYNSLPER